jgi:hypothetical protein
MIDLLNHNFLPDASSHKRKINLFVSNDPTDKNNLVSIFYQKSRCRETKIPYRAFGKM